MGLSSATPVKEPPAAAAPPARLAYARAAASDREREPMSEPGHRLYWMSDSFFSCIDLAAGDEHHIVAGVHSQCDLRLEGDRTLDDRHLLLRSETLDDGCPVLKVLDLDTRAGFFLTDGSAPHSISAIGPIVLRLGTLMLVALPAGERLPDELPEARCTRVRPRTERRLVPLQPVPPVVVAPIAGAESPRRVSDVRVLPGPIQISELSDLSELDPARRVAAGYELTLETATDRAVFRLTLDDLDHGVLVGRDPRRCVANRVLRIFHVAVSRVHLLLLRQRDSIVVHDVASMNGTWVDRRRVRVARLDDDGTELLFGSNPTIRATWVAVRGA